MKLPEVQLLGTDFEVCVDFLSPKKSSGDKRNQHWINLREMLTLPSSVVFQDGIAAEDIHDIPGHRKFIREKNAGFVYAFGNLWNFACMENYSKTVTALY